MINKHERTPPTNKFEPIQQDDEYEILPAVLNYCEKIGLSAWLVIAFLAGSARHEPLSQAEIIEFNNKSLQNPIVASEIKRPQPSAEPWSTATSVSKNTESISTEQLYPDIQQTKSTPETHENQEVQEKDYFEKSYQPNESQQEALQALRTGSKLEILGVDNGADLCPEPGCFRVNIEVKPGLQGLKEVASDKKIAGYYPESPLSDTPETYGKDSKIIAWEDEIWLNIHNRSNYSWMKDAAWADLENLAKDSIVTVVDSNEQQFEFVVIAKDILLSSDNFYRDAAVQTVDEYGGARLWIQSCTDGGRDSDNLQILTLIPNPEQPEVENN